MYPCPACGKATRVTQTEALRICAVCRKVSPVGECTPENAPPPKRKSSTDDSVGSTDVSFGWIDNTVVPPRFPCKQCGKETKEHHGEGERICKPCGNLIQ